MLGSYNRDFDPRLVGVKLFGVLWPKEAGEIIGNGIYYRLWPFLI